MEDDFWTLDQVAAWARSRSYEAVAFARERGGVALEIKINVEIQKAVAQGHNIETELWGSTGRQQPDVEDALSLGAPPFIAVMGGREIELEAVAVPEPFPIDDHIQKLLEGGKLAAYGRVGNDPVSRKIEKFEWSGLQIVEDKKTGWRVVRRGDVQEVVIGDVRLLRKAVVEIFGENVAATAVKGRGGRATPIRVVRELLNAEIQKAGGFLSQNNCAEIVRANFPGVSRDVARKIAKDITGNTKQGPRGARG